MPYLDLNSEPTITDQNFDIIVVGAGAAGILLAVKLSQAGKKVLLIESGHFNEDEKRQELNNVTQTGKTLSNAVWGRKRAVGGTTIAWGGQSLPFSDIDFEYKDWVKHSGWPISFSDLEQHYPVANRFMGVDELDYGDDIFNLLKMKKLSFNPRKLLYHFSKWAPEPNFKKLYDDHLVKNVTVVYNAVVTKINIGENGKVSDIVVSNYHNNEVRVKVNILVLSPGTIEANRLLLTNDHQAQKGIGNHSGWLGKCFMDHPCIEVGNVISDNQYRLQSHFNTHYINKRKYSIRLSLSEEVQRNERLTNGSAGIMFYYPDDVIDPYIEVRNYIKSRQLKSFSKLISNIGVYAISAKALLKDRLIYKHNAKARLVMMMEQEPDTDSCITLSSERDRFDIPKANIHWSITKSTWNSTVFMAQEIRSELERLSIGTVKLHPSVEMNNINWIESLTDVNHHMGGTRMSDTPENGVVDKNLKVWGVDNLFICSASVFPTGSHSNPTLTLLALASRLAKKLS